MEGTPKREIQFALRATPVAVNTERNLCSKPKPKENSQQSTAAKVLAEYSQPQTPSLKEEEPKSATTQPTSQRQETLAENNKTYPETPTTLGEPEKEVKVGAKTKEGVHRKGASPTVVVAVGTQTEGPATREYSPARPAAPTTIRSTTAEGVEIAPDAIQGCPTTLKEEGTGRTVRDLNLAGGKQQRRTSEAAKQSAALPEDTERN